MKDELLNIANSRYNGRYVFNGQKVDQMPYTEKTAASAFTDAGKIIYDIGAGVQIDINYSGGEILEILKMKIKFLKCWRNFPRPWKTKITIRLTP
ncbi:hypothetical protein P7H22_05030 [Paenibacillus larvae]|nr:hypothetical protein [Paenibacillus larvae]MDT2239864.1 hypothetical protein [Paenibacillus larvae]